jgi:AcrR family transcriptional regulator
MAIADREGLDAVTIRRLSSELGFSAMALYRHVGSHGELVLHMVDEALGRPALQEHPDWRDSLRAWTRGLYQRYLTHPWLLDARLAGAPVTANHAAWVEDLLERTQDLALPTERRLEAGLLLDGHARMHARLRRDTQRPPTDRPGPAGGASYPLLTDAMVRGHLWDLSPQHLDWGVDIVLSGLDAASSRG